jgi:hypothetical protein
MNVRKLSMLSLFAALMLVFTSSAFAQELTTKQWRVFNINRDVAKLWDINKAGSAPTGIVGFTFPQLNSGWYAVYLNTNYGDLSSMSTLSAYANWTNAAYVNRASSPSNSAYFRFYFQSAEGNYNSNDYWWSTDACYLNITSSCNLNASLNDPTKWTNLCGQSATDTTPHPGPNCVGGTDPNVSPADGFINAKRNVKNVGLSFGGGSFYANGVANSQTTPTTFTLVSYAVQ